MERLVITIHPARTDEQLLRVADAMQQVLDIVRVHDEAARDLGADEAAIEWRLERASANSPFTITAIAESTDPLVDISPQARLVKQRVSSDIQRIIRGERAEWMGQTAVDLTRSIFRRNQNGIATTAIDFGVDTTLSITRDSADAGSRTLDSIDVLRVDEIAGDQIAWGEIIGVMVAAGLYYKKPAIQLRTAQYGLVWCQLSEPLIHKFGDTARMSDLWQGKTVGAEGKLTYGTGGKLVRIDASDVRELPDIPRIDLDAVLDPDFTSGLDPAEYLRQFHEGELAF